MPEVNNLIDHSGSCYPVSRDWDIVECGRKACLYNCNGACLVSSLIKLGADGRCERFKLRPTPEDKA